MDYCGLGNRLISIGCVSILAAELNYNLKVFWGSGKVVGDASFGDLFESTNLPFELVEGREALIMRDILFSHSAYHSPLKKMGFRLLRHLVLAQHDKIMAIPKGYVKSKGGIVKELLPFRRIALFKYTPLIYGCDLSWLKPSHPIARQVAELKQQFTPNTVGIHIRGTDLPYVPPVEKMITKMRAEIELDPNVKFFLSSDGDRKTEAVVTLFEDRLIKRNSAMRGTRQGQQDAVVDLFGLAATSRIIGFDYSTFATTAALIGNKPLLKLAEGT